MIENIEFVNLRMDSQEMFFFLAKQKLWEKAVQYINEHESRVRTEVQTVHGESFDVWRWIGSANLSIGR